MPIVYYGGVEGSGKTTLMTRDLKYHHYCGGRVFAFPGYQLLNDRGKEVSELLYPHQWIKLLREEVYDYAVAIDEVQNFLNKHNWYDDIVDLLSYGAAAQRRKRRFAICVTGPIFDWLPKDLKDMFHEVIEMQDRHWKTKSIPRGEQFLVVREDRRGMLSGKVGTKTFPRIFHGKKYRKNFNSYSIIDPEWQLRKFNIRRNSIQVDADGNEIIEETEQEKFIKEWGWLVEKLRQMRSDGMRFLKPAQLTVKLGRALTKRIRDQLPVFGVVWDNQLQMYAIDGLSLPESDSAPPLPL